MHQDNSMKNLSNFMLLLFLAMILSGPAHALEPQKGLEGHGGVSDAPEQLQGKDRENRKEVALPAMDADRYEIAPGDALEISVWKDESLTRQLIVPPDGIISFPLVGDIDVKGLNVTKLRDILTKKLSVYVPDSTVTVMLLGANSLSAYVIGKVNKPGQFPIGMDTNVMQILAMAGGLNPFASQKDIIILRKHDDRITKIPFNYKEVKKGENLEQCIKLERGDVVVVP
jgi:polysaccharide export outer membrane protein